jgi:hypothetical protein
VIPSFDSIDRFINLLFVLPKSHSSSFAFRALSPMFPRHFEVGQAVLE